MPQVLDKQKPGKREGTRSHRYPVTESDNPDDPGWESEVRSREEELSRYEGSILAREFKERLAYNMGQVLILTVSQQNAALLQRDSAPTGNTVIVPGLMLRGLSLASIVPD